jgi:transposase InsO family protein
MLANLLRRNEPPSAQLPQGESWTFQPLIFLKHTLQDWRRTTKIYTSYCDRDSPWQNGQIESFNLRLRDEFVTLEIFDSMWEIRFMLEEHRKNYNYYRPHSALGCMTLVEFATKWKQGSLLPLSQVVDR